MTTTNSSTEERLSRLEGAYEHLATKADVADLRAELAGLKVLIAESEARVSRQLFVQTRWFVTFMLSGMGFMTAIGFGIAKLLQ